MIARLRMIVTKTEVFEPKCKEHEKAVINQTAKLLTKLSNGKPFSPKASEQLSKSQLEVKWKETEAAAPNQKAKDLVKICKERPLTKQEADEFVKSLGLNRYLPKASEQASSNKVENQEIANNSFGQAYITHP